MANPSEPSGINSVEPPPAGSSPAQTVEHYLAGYEAQFKRARRTVKRRASRVTIWASILTGLIAVLGSISAVLSTDWISAAVAIATTLVSSVVAALLAWNDHFHHRELWIQRSEVLAEINVLRRRFAMRSSLPRHMRRAEDRDAVATLEALNEVLQNDLESWKRIQNR